MDLSQFAEIKIKELIEIKKIFNKPIKEAVPLMREICERNKITWEQGKTLCSIVKRIDGT